MENSQVFGGNAVDDPRDLAINNTNTSLFIGSRSFSTDGDVPSNAGASDYWIMKRDINGSLLWSKTFGGLGNDDLEVVMPHPDGGVLAFGTTRTDQGLFGDLTGLAGGWLMRTNNNGTITDGKIYGGSVTEIAVDAYRHLSGNITLAMESGSPVLNGQTNNGIFDVAIIHVNPSLTPEWTLLMGGSGADVPEAITSDLNGNIYVAATSESNLPGLDPNQGGKDVWIIKIAADGEILWQKSFGGSEDDIASDIVFHPDGHVYLLAHSQSADGDFDTNDGLNDLWMIKLAAEDGNTEGMYRFGGSGNDFNGHADLYLENKLVITASSTSQDNDLTGNKGFTDVWVFTTDLNGQMDNQMNYGGSLSDLTIDILTIDSSFHVLASTLSSDKNVPQNVLAQNDLWYFILNPFPDTCSDQFLCQPDSNLTNHLYPPANEALVCVNGCNAGFGPGPNFNNGNCQNFTNPTAYFFVTTDTTADLLTLSVHSDEFNEPQIALLRSVNCTTFIPIECAVGSGGNVVISYIDIDPLSTYVVAVTDAAGNIGQFEFCATSVDVEFCNESDRIYATSTSLGSPLKGPYKPGEEVRICYELEDWKKLDCNGFQGLVPSFGPGWDSTYFDLFGQPINVDVLLAPETTGFWQWYKVGDVRYNVTNPINGYDGGQGMPAGWYFTNTADPPPNDGPDQTVGDIATCLPTSDEWRVCFTLKVVDECEANIDCSVSMKTFADGEIGVNSSLACAYDQEEIFSAYMRCCLNPSIDPIQNFSVCSGDTISFAPETNLLPPVKYSWTVVPDPFINGAAPANDVNQFYQILENEVAVPLLARYSLVAESDGCETEPEEFDITILPKPSCRITVTGPNIVCSGSTVTFNFESTGTPPFAIGLYRNNEPFANILSETNLITLDIDPVFSGTFRVGSLEDAFCEGSGIGFVNVTVKPVSSSAVDTILCEGESYFIGDEEFTEAGVYEVTIDGGAENNCDSTVVLTLNYAPTLTETIDEVICNGDTLFVLDVPYTETIDTLIEYSGPEGCPNYIDLQLLVKDTFTMEIEQTICNGDTLDFGGLGVYEAGDYYFTEEVRPGCYEQTILHLNVLPAILINDLAIIADDGNNNGAILVEITGGNPPFTYLWSSGQTTESLFNIAHGTYTLTVTDRLACTEVFSFDVPFINATEHIHNASGYFQLRPNPFNNQQALHLVNLSNTPYTITAWHWRGIDGKNTILSCENEFIPGGQTLVEVPQSLAPGMYYLGAADSAGHMHWVKAILLKE